MKILATLMWVTYIGNIFVCYSLGIVVTDATLLGFLAMFIVFIMWKLGNEKENKQSSS